MSTIVNLIIDEEQMLWPATKSDLDLIRDKFRPGEPIKAELTKPRSLPQNKLFHSLMEFAYHHQRAGLHFESWRHLKAWVLVEIGHCETFKFEAGSMTPQVAAALRKRFDFVVFSTVKKTGEIIMRFAKSVAFNEVSAEEMTKIVDQAFEIVADKIVPGTTVEQLHVALGVEA